MSAAHRRLRTAAVEQRAATAGTGEAVWRVLFGAAGAFCLITLSVVCLLPFRDQLDPGTVALIMLIPPVAAASGGLWLGVGAAAFSARRVQLLLHPPVQLVPHREQREHRRASSSTCSWR